MPSPRRPDLPPQPEVAAPAPEQPFLRRRRSVLLAPDRDGQRRRGTDGMRPAAAILAAVCCLLIIHCDSRADRAIVAVIHPPPRSITWLVTVVYQAGSLGVVIAPSPGGMGVVEAGLIRGLAAAGVSEADATAAVFIQRLFTSYLPPIWGWFTLAWMRGRDSL